MINSTLLAIICLMTTLLGGHAQTPSFELGHEQSILLGREILADGKPEVALALARALISRDGLDPEVLVLLSAALQQQGEFEESNDAARTAYTLSVTDHQKFESAMLAGRAHFQRGAHSRSQFWLRRAVHAAPDVEAQQIAKRNFQHVRRKNPVELRFNLALSPSSNINDGTNTETIELFGLPFQLRGASRALSGTELAFNLGLRHRIAQSERSETAVTAQVESRSYRLSREAKLQAPEARGSDYSFRRVEVGAVHRFTPLTGSSIYEIAGAFGRTWQADQTMSDYARLSLSQSFQLHPATGLRFTLSTQRQRRYDNAARSATIYGLQGEVGHELQTGARLILVGSLRQTEAEASYIQNTALGAQITYIAAEPVAGISFASTVELMQRRFPTDIMQPAGRRDLRGSLRVSATFDEVEYMGFSPLLDLQVSRTKSNVAVHERQSINMSVGISSRF